MWADTIEKARELVNHPMFGYARPDYHHYEYVVYYNTPNNDGPARGRKYAGSGPTPIMRQALAERERKLTFGQPGSDIVGIWG